MSRCALLRCDVCGHDDDDSHENRVLATVDRGLVLIVCEQCRSRSLKPIAARRLTRGSWPPRVNEP